MRYSTCIGIDVHSAKNAVCAFNPQTGETRDATFGADAGSIIRWIRDQQFEGPIGCVYESGPTGFGLARALNGSGLCTCLVAATCRISYPRDKQKNDRNDARFLATELAAFRIHPVRIPTPQEESLCRLSKLRAEAACDLRRAKQRVSSFLLVTGTRYTKTKKLWTKTFLNWASTYEFECPADTFTFREKLAEAQRQMERLGRIEGQMLDIIDGDAALKGRMARLMAVHGVGKVTAFSLICEVYDFTRFRNGRSFASFLGLVPTEHSSGKKVSHGCITKLGNSNLRRLIIESAGCYGKRANIAKPKATDVSAAVALKAQECTDRLLARRRYLKERGMTANKAKCAIARELAEWIYYIMVMPA